MSSSVADLSEEQKLVLQQFRKNVEDILMPYSNAQEKDSNPLHPQCGDGFLLRWLRAREFNIKRSEEMLRNHMIIRKKYGFDTILTDFTIPEVHRKYVPFYHTGYDREGNCVSICDYGSVDLSGLARSLSLEDHLKVVVYIVEDIFSAMIEENKKHSRNGRKILLVLDMKNLKSAHVAFDRKVIKRLLHLIMFFQDHIPDVLKCCYIINVPRFLPFAYKVLKAVMCAEVAEKFKLYSSDYDKVLVDEIGADVLPACLGGNLTDPDGNPECLTMLVKAEKIPLSYYFSSKQTLAAKDPGMTQIVIGGRTYQDIKVRVKLLDQIIIWRFHSMHHDIGFGLLYVGDENLTESRKTEEANYFEKGYEILIPPDRINSHERQVEGEFHCAKTGIYILRFDNTYSWLTTKVLYYKVEVVPANDNSPEVFQ